MHEPDELISPTNCQRRPKKSTPTETPQTPQKKEVMKTTTKINNLWSNYIEFHYYAVWNAMEHINWNLFVVLCKRATAGVGALAPGCTTPFNHELIIPKNHFCIIQCTRVCSCVLVATHRHLYSSICEYYEKFSSIVRGERNRKKTYQIIWTQKSFTHRMNI